MSESAPRRRWGVLGGSFDPVHLGHLLGAQDACEQCALERVVFMPTAQAPLKGRTPGLPAELRVELLRAAVAGDARFEISTLEIERGGTSYTIETVRELRRRFSRDDIFWIIGADQAGLLAQWREIDALAALVEFIVLARPGFVVPVAGLPAGVKLHPVSAHVFDISSSEIRERLAARRPVRLFLPNAVAERLEREPLYPPTSPHGPSA